jgi:predicted RNA-binding protein with TRAM domain
VKLIPRKGIRLGLVAGLVATGLVGVTSLTASGEGDPPMVDYGTLRIEFDTTSSPSTGVVTYTPPPGSVQPVLTQPIVTVQPCNTIAFGAITDGTGEIPGNLLNVTPQAVGSNGVASNAGSVQLTKIGAGVQISGNDCGDPSGQIGPGEQMTLAVGSYFDPAVVATSAELEIGKRQDKDGVLTIAFDDAANGKVRTTIEPIATGGERKTVADGTDDFRIISLRSTAKQSSRGLSLLSTTEINLVAPAEATAPGAPTIVQNDSGDQQATIGWTGPTDTGGSPVTGYILRYYPTDTPLATVTVDPAETPEIVGGLTNGTTYTFEVSAVNDAGEGPAATTTVTPATVPDAPTIVQNDSGDQQATIGWTGPTDTGGSPVTGYILRYYPTDTPLATVTVDPAETPEIVGGLTNGTTYTFEVSAVNDAGEGPAATTTVTPATVPDAPTIVQNDSGDQQATIGWTGPTDTGGSPVTGYILRYYPTDTPLATVTVDPAETPEIVGGLTNGTTYTFEVSAVNDAGEGPAATTTVTPATVPDAPTIVQNDSGDQQATIGWTGPTDTGGSPVTGYILRYYPTDTPLATVTVDPAETPEIVGGLTNGTNYTFEVSAVNDAGEGPAATTTVIPGSVAVACNTSAPPETEEGAIADEAVFFRLENKDGESCEDVLVTVDIVTNGDPVGDAGV